MAGHPSADCQLGLIISINALISLLMAIPDNIGYIEAVSKLGKAITRAYTDNMKFCQMIPRWHLIECNGNIASTIHPEWGDFHLVM